MKTMFNNPVLNKEFKLRFRTGKSFFGLLFYLLAIGILAIGFVYVQSISSMYGFFRSDESRIMFMFLSMIQLILLLFVTPGLTAGVVSGEREKQTLNILLTTTQSSLSIILGKLISSVSYLLILMISTLPLYSFVFLYGGVSPSQVFSLFAIYIITIFAFGGIGIMFSTLLRKTIGSVISSYGVMLFLSVGTAILFFISSAISMGVNYTATSHPLPYIFAVSNPFIVTFSILNPAYAEEINQMLFNIDIPLWLPYSILYCTIFFVTTLISVRKLRPKMK